MAQGSRDGLGRSCRRRERRGTLLLRVPILVLLLTLLAIFPGASGVGNGNGVFLWFSPVPARAGEAAVRQMDGQWLSGLEKRIHALLTPVYGAEHVVVQASFGEAEKETARPPVSVAIIVDTSVLKGVPTSAEGMRAEQERLRNLVSHAAGLNENRGDSIAVSFLLFTDRDRLETWWLAAAGLAGLLVLLLVVLLVRSLARGRQVRQISDKKEREPVRNMTGKGADRNRCAALARRLGKERPQARAVALALLEPDVAASVLEALPRNMQAETIARMVLQGHVEEDVLALVRGTFLQDFTDEEIVCFDEGRDAALETLAVLQAMDRSSQRRITQEVRRTAPRAWEELADLQDGGR